MSHQIAMLSYWCPLCGGAERMGECCGCGLLWKEERRAFGHYAVLLSGDDAERLREKLSRRLTFKILNEQAAAEQKQRGGST